MGIFEDKVRKYHERLKKDFQIKDHHSFGIWGNIGGETGGFKHLQELNPVVKGSRGGLGWSQWTGPRRKKYEAWCAAKGMDPRSDEANYQYLVHETLTDEWKSLAQVRKTTTLEAATETWMKLNLRPGIPHLEGRINWAKKAQAAVKGVSLPTKAVIIAGAAGTTAAVAQYTPTNYLPHVAAVVVGIGLIYAAIMYFKKGK